MDEHGVTFKWKDYRVKNGSKGHTRHKTMTLEPGEFMRRFLLHVLPGGLHRIRHDGLLANGSRKTRLALACDLLCQPALAAVPADGSDLQIQRPSFVCLHCGCAMVILQTFTRGHGPASAPRRRHRRDEHHVHSQNAAGAAPLVAGWAALRPSPLEALRPRPRRYENIVHWRRGRHRQPRRRDVERRSRAARWAVTSYRVFLTEDAADDLLRIEDFTKVVWEGKIDRTFIGDASQDWDECLLVRYPSRQHFLAMMANAAYREALVHRYAGLECTTLLQMQG